MLLLIVSVLVAVPLPLVVTIVALPPRLTPLVSVTPFFFHTKVTGVLADTVVVKVAVVPWATVWFDSAVVAVTGTQTCVQVESFTATVSGSSVLKAAIPVALTCPWLQTWVGPTGNGLFTVTENMMTTFSPTGIVPRLLLIISPLNIGLTAGAAFAPAPKLMRFARRSYEPGITSAVGLNTAGLRSRSDVEESAVGISAVVTSCF